MESPKRKMQKKNDYQRHKLFRKIKRRRKAQVKADQEVAEKQLKKKLKMPKFGDGKEKINLDDAHFDQDGNLVVNSTGVSYTPIVDDVVITPNTKYFYDPYVSAGNYFDGNWSKDLINAMPGIGDGMDVAQVIDDASKGKYLSAGTGALMLALPNAIEKPLKYFGRKGLPLLFKYYNKIDPRGQYKQLFKNLESDGNLMSVDDILKEYSSSGHFRMPTHQDHIDRNTKISPLQLFMARQTSAGRQFNPRIVEFGSPEYYNYASNRRPYLLKNPSNNGSFAFMGNSETLDPYDAVIFKNKHNSRRDLEQAITHELSHSLQRVDNFEADDLALKAFGHTPISNKYFMNIPHSEFGARGTQLKNAMGIYVDVKPGQITSDDYWDAISNYPHTYFDNNISDMRKYTSNFDAAAKFIQDYSFDSGKDIHIKPSKRGTFTKAAKARGMSVQEFANKVLKDPSKYSSTMRKKANFAHNAASWKH